MLIKKSPVKINWLVNYVKKIFLAYDGVISDQEPDFSQDRAKIVFHDDRFRHFLLGQDDRILPITMEGWTSLTCNARCPNCTYTINQARNDSYRANQKLFSDISILRDILTDFSKAGIKSIIWTGGGEPTLNPQLSETVKMTKKVGLEWGIFTHGMNLSEKITKDLLSYEPRFFRISIKAGTAKSHYHEYKIHNNSYSIVKKNVIDAAKMTSYNKLCVGLGYALDGTVSKIELEGIKQFINDVMDESGGKLGFAAFRPKVICYKKNGEILLDQPLSNNLIKLPNMIEEYIIQPLKARFGDDLKLDLKRAMFNRLASPSSPKLSLATPWAGSMNHLGEGFILSELNGSPWKNTKYGSFAKKSFTETWFSKERIRLMELYKSGQILAPVHHKLSHVDEMLIEIRNRIGILKNNEVDEFFKQLNKMQKPNIKNWDFL